MSGFSLVATLVVAIGSRYIVRWSRDARDHLTRTIRLRLGKTAKCINSTAKESNKKIAPKSDFFMYDVPIAIS